MQPDTENMVNCLVDKLNHDLMNSSASRAYPQLVPDLMNLGHNLKNVFINLLASNRRELFFGEEPWAKLYELQTGNRICVPDKSIIKNLCSSNFVTVGDRPWSHILKYFLDGWANPEGDEEWHFFLDGPTDYNNQVVLNFDSKEATYYWEKNDMQMTLPDFSRSSAVLSSPMFHTPYDVDVEYSYIERTLLDQLLARMLEIWEIEETAEVSHDLFIHEHYHGTSQVPVKLPDDHDVNRLSLLLNAGKYSQYDRATYSYVDYSWKDYTLQFSTKRDWSYSPSIVLKVSVMAPEQPHGGQRPVSSWWKNPLLVADLKHDLDGIIKTLLVDQEQPTKEV